MKEELMNKLNEMTLAAFLTIGLLAGASFTTQAAESPISSKDAVLKTVIATPGYSKVSGQSVDTAAYNSKAIQSGSLAGAKANAFSRSVDMLAYNSKAR